MLGMTWVKSHVFVTQFYHLENEMTWIIEHFQIFLETNLKPQNFFLIKPYLKAQRESPRVSLFSNCGKGVCLHGFLEPQENIGIPNHRAKLAFLKLDSAYKLQGILFMRRFWLWLSAFLVFLAGLCGN